MIEPAELPINPSAFQIDCNAPVFFVLFGDSFSVSLIGIFLSFPPSFAPFKETNKHNPNPNYPRCIQKRATVPRRKQLFETDSMSRNSNFPLQANCCNIIDLIPPLAS